MPQLYQGARPQAWRILFIMASLGAGVGSLGYFSKLSETLHTLPSLQATYGRYALCFSLFITIFLKISYGWAADRQGRPLSLLSLVLYPLLNVLGEGMLLLFIFDVGRWLRPWFAGGPAPSWADFRAVLGSAALESPGSEHPLFWTAYVWGFAPYTLAHAVLYAYLQEPLVLPEHFPEEAPNVFMKAIVVAQCSYITVYYFTGDVAAYCLLRWLADVLTAVAVRMPPPGTRPAAAAPAEAAKEGLARKKRN